VVLVIPRLARPLALAAALGAAQAWVVPAPASAGTRTVAAGETLSGVAASLGVSVAALAQANGIADVHRIQAGRRLVVPAKGAKGAAPASSKAPASPAGQLPERLRARPDRMALIPVFDAAAQEFGVPADLLKAMTWLESGWQNSKVSSTKAVGIGQLMPATIAFVNDVLLKADLDPRRPEHNIRMSARFLAYLLRQNNGDVGLALSSYYQGLASVRRHGPLPQTHRYVADVLALRRRF
jgi:soluble lytic murein transglycosylase-like protein